MRQQANEDRQLRHAGNQFFDPHTGNVDLRQGDAQVGIAFVGADHQATRFGDGEVDAGDARLGREEFFAQVPACGFRQVFRVGGAGGRPQVLMENLPDVFFLQMDRRQHDMTGRFLAKLHDPFAEIGVDDFDSVLFEERIEVTFLGQHRLTLGDAGDSVLLQDAQHDLVMGGSIARPVDVTPFCSAWSANCSR